MKKIRIVLLALLVLFTFMFSSCGDLLSNVLNENFKLSAPDIAEDLSFNNEDNGGKNNGDDDNNNDDDDNNNDDDDNNNGDDDNTKKFNIKFDSSEDWSWHWCPDEEFSLSKSVPEKLNYLTDYIEFTIKGTPNMDVYRLGIQVANDFGTLTEQFIPAKFTAKEKFEKKVRVSLFKDYDPSENYHLIVCYDPKPGAYNNFGLEINNFSVTAYAVKNDGFNFTKDPWSSDFDDSYCYNHRLNGETWFAENHSKKYVNVRLECNSPVEITNLLFTLITTDWKEIADFRICKLINGFNAVDVSFSVDSQIPLDSEIMLTGFTYLKEDVDKQLSLTDVHVECSFTDEPLYVTINTDAWESTENKEIKGSYTISNGVLTVSGIEEIEDKFCSNRIIDMQQIKKIVIGDDVKIIGSWAFIDCWNVQDVVLGKSVEIVKLNAFNDLGAIQNIYIPYSIKQISDNGFDNIWNSSLNIYLDWNADDIQKRTIPFNANFTTGNIFYKDGTLVNDYSQDYWTSSYDESSKVLTVKGRGAVGTYNYFPIANPDGNNSNEVLSQFKDIDVSKIVVENGITSINGPAFMNLGVSEVVLPDSVTEIGSYAFYGCKNLEKINLSSKLTRINDYAFDSCNISKIVIPDTVTDLSQSAFNNWKRNQTIKINWNSNIPERHDIYPFNEYTGPSAKYRNNVSAWGGATIENGEKHYYDAETVVIFNDNEDVTKVVVEEGVRIIQYSYSSDANTTITTVKLPDTLNKITFAAFKNFTKLENIVIPEHVTDIGSEAFSNCSSLKSIIIPDSVNTLDYGAFSNCTSLESINLPKDVHNISSRCFEYCTSLKTVNHSSYISSIGDSAFYKCKSLTDFEFQNTIESIYIGEYAFYGCTGIKEIRLPASTFIIGAMAFDYWTPEQTIYLDWPQSDNSSKNIDKDAFGFGGVKVIYKNE